MSITQYIKIIYITIADAYTETRSMDFSCADPPGKPGTPKIDDVDAESVSLSWDKPKDDGVDKVKGYVVEAKEKGSNKWVPLNPKTPCKDTKFIGKLY